MYRDYMALPATPNTMIIDQDPMQDIHKYKDPINPIHYQTGKNQAIDVMKHDFKIDMEGYCLGNVIKYLYRYRNKGGSKDLEKAKWYLTRLINEVKEVEIFGENEQTAPRERGTV